MSETRRLLDRLEFALKLEEDSPVYAIESHVRARSERIASLKDDIAATKQRLAEESSRPDEETLVLA